MVDCSALRPRHHRPNPPLAEVQVAEEERLPHQRPQVERVRQLGHAGCGDAQLAGASLPTTRNYDQESPLVANQLGDHPFEPGHYPR